MDVVVIEWDLVVIEWDLVGYKWYKPTKVIKGHML